ncbi:MAG: T9SS type A sorting domain-containing protein [Candidatus Delongbacteria bacterium]|jgi:hypothetical protein|nr:T9SS type A sorting domain-containing protein [Candidatus Delongbacteria bacterium]
MKKVMFYLPLIFLMNAAMFGQYVVADFEPAGLGADLGWTVGENGDNPAVEFIDNPVSSGINTSATIAKFTARASGQDWALCYTSVDEFIFNASNSTVKIMVNKPVISNIGIKFEGSSPAVEIQVPNTVIDQWEEITFDFSASIGNTYSTLTIIPDFASRAQDNIIYFDNIQLPEANTAPTPEPTVAAPTPTVSESGVISLFSDAYTNVTVDTWSAGWDDASVSDVYIDSNATKKYSSLNFAGIEFTSEPINASSMTDLHMDIWTPDDTANPAVFKIKLIDFGADGLYGGGDDVEHEIILDETIMDTETWVRLNIPLTDFINLTTKEHLAQMILAGDPNTVYLDNIYFYDNTVGISDDEAHELGYTLEKNYPNPFNPTTSIKFSINKPGNVSLKVFDANGQHVKTLIEGNLPVNSYNVSWNATNDNKMAVASGNYFYRLSVDNKIVDTKSMMLIK